MRDLMARLRLTVNETKTRLCRIPNETFDFLGYTIGRCYDRRTGRAFIGTRPSKKRIRRMCEDIHASTERKWTPLSEGEMVAHLNRKLKGWANYFCLGPVSRAYRAVDSHVQNRLRQRLCAKHQVQGRGTARWPDKTLYGTLGLVRLERLTRNFPWAKA